MRVITTLVVLFVSASVAWSTDWPRWRGPQGDAICRDSQIAANWEQSPPKLLWQAQGFGEGYASVSIADGRIFTLGFKDGKECLFSARQDDGSILWKTELPQGDQSHKWSGARCTPTVDGANVYVITVQGDVACVARETGKIVWQRNFADDFGGQMMSQWNFSESPLIDGDHLLCTPGGPAAAVVCLNKYTGADVWRCQIPELGPAGKDGAGYSSIVISEACGVKQYVQLLGRGLIGIRASDGKFLWGYNKVANTVANIPTPLPFGDHVFASSGYKDGGTCLVKLTKSGDGISAEEVYWKDAKELQNHHGGMILKDGYVYIGNKHGNGFPTCVEVETGKIVWGGEVRGPGAGSAAILMVGDNLIFRYEDGVVALISATPKEYVLKGSFTPVVQENKSWAHPVVVDGRLYLREQNTLMCYQLQ